MTKLLILSLLVAPVFAQAATCTYTFTNHAGEVLSTGEKQDVKYKEAQEIPHTAYEYTLDDVRVSPDTYIEFIAMDVISEGKRIRMKCDDSFVYENNLYVGVKSVCHLTTADLSVVCKF